MPAAKSASHLKLAGTERPDRARSDPPKMGEVVKEAPARPSWLVQQYAVEEWDRIVPIMVAGGILTPGRITLLAQMCALHGQIAQAYAAGTMPPANMQATFRMMLVDLGISDSQMAKGNGGDEGRGNKFARNGRRPGRE